MCLAMGVRLLAGVSHIAPLQRQHTDMLVTVDTNAGEDAVFAALSETGIDGFDIRRQRLDVGDVRISLGSDGLTVVLERKTWADLASSICDGRLAEQKSRMVEGRVRYAYVIEGMHVEDWDGSYRKLSHKCMWAALVKLQLRDNVDVMFARSPSDMATLVCYIAQQMREGGFQQGVDRSAISGVGVVKRKRDNLLEPLAALRAMLTVIPGMSSSKAEIVVAAFPSVAHLVAAHQAEIATLACGSRTLGPKMALALKAIFLPLPLDSGAVPSGDATLTL